MKFTDLFINKPVLAIVVSLVLLLLGTRAGLELNVRKFPQLENAVVTVTTVYVGADANLIQGFITTPLEREIASAEGVDYITSSSIQNVSMIQAYLRLNYNPNEALTQVMAKVNKIRSNLPENIEEPTIDLAVGETMAAMYLSFYSEVLSNNHITDYLVRIVQPKLATIPGVQRANILGDKVFAMRIWLDPTRMTALAITPSDVYRVLQANNSLTAIGSTKSNLITIDLKAQTDLHTVKDFENLAIKSSNNAIIYLRDIAKIELGSANYDFSTIFNGQNATFIGIEVAPDANALDVIKAVKTVFTEQIVPQLPEKLAANIPYDSTKYINDAIKEVIKTIIEALVIVIVVIYLFLGSMRSVLIPAVAVPLSLIGALFLMLLCGFSLNLLTLLAMVLAIGIVVDDAIIVLENIYRHIEAGITPYNAAIQGARELAWPIIAMTTTLVAVYLPIGFMGGLTGKLFIEFALTLAGSVLLSGVVALTLSPMMCAKLLLQHKLVPNKPKDFATWIDTKFDQLRDLYQRYLVISLQNKQVILVFALIVLASCYFLFVTSPRELEPKEDQGIILIAAEADPYITLNYLEHFTKQINEIAATIPEIEKIFLINGIGSGGFPSSNNAFAGFVLKSFAQRKLTTYAVQQQLQQKLSAIPGLQIAAFIPPALPTPGRGFPVEFIICATDHPENLQEVSEQILMQAYASRKFIFLNTDLKINKPKFNVKIDRKKAAALGITMQDLGRDLSILLSGNLVNRFAMESRSYQVIPQVIQAARSTPEQLKNYYTRTSHGKLISLATLITLELAVEPMQLQKFQQLNSVTISGVPRPGVTIPEALEVLDKISSTVMPENYNKDYAGQSRQFKQEGNSLVLTFIFALLMIYLVLAAQFESFIDPLIMLITVPMSICGAMLFVSLGLVSLNIYTQVGLITLIGVISKHGILIVEFANKLQLQGKSKTQAIIDAAAIRLRPVIMTTIALVLAMVPLLITSGPGSGARFSMGLIIASGMTIGTIFTLFVVPTFYLYLAKNYSMHIDHTNIDNAA